MMNTMGESRDGAACRWLLLIFSLPTRQASGRVEVWRKLRKSGALALGSSGYVLPNTPANRERFEWIATAIRRYRGQASVIQAHSMDVPPEELVRRFNEARTRDYEALARDAKKILASPQRSNAQLTRLRRRFHDVGAIDFFDSPMRGRVEAVLARADDGPNPAASPTQTKKKEQFANRTWVTRPRPGIDRVSSAWLIRRFIDRGARFVFAVDPKQQPGAVPFDMFGGVGFGHRGDDCTFETLRKEFGIRDPKVAAIAQVVHDADLCDEKFGRNEGLGLDRILIGWAEQGVSDDELLRRGMEIIDGLYQAVAPSV